MQLHFLSRYHASKLGSSPSRLGVAVCRRTRGVIDGCEKALFGHVESRGSLGVMAGEILTCCQLLPSRSMPNLPQVA